MILDPPDHYARWWRQAIGEAGDRFCIQLDGHDSRAAGCERECGAPRARVGIHHTTRRIGVRTLEQMRLELRCNLRIHLHER